MYVVNRTPTIKAIEILQNFWSQNWLVLLHDKIPGQEWDGIQILCNNAQFRNAKMRVCREAKLGLPVWIGTSVVFDVVVHACVYFSRASDNVSSSAGEWYLPDHRDRRRGLRGQTQPQIHSYCTHRIRHSS